MGKRRNKTRVSKKGLPLLVHGGLAKLKDTRRRLPKVSLYVAGVCENPGRGGWAALLEFISPTTGEVIEKELSGYYQETTTNRIVMMAAIFGIESLKFPCAVTVYSDSLILIKGGSIWLERWKANDWQRAKPSPKSKVQPKRIANVFLWKRLDAAMSEHRVWWRWIKGHNGQREKERVDALANRVLSAGIFRCMDCGINTNEIGEYPLMLNYKVWGSIVPDGIGMLCQADMEKRLGRPLTAADRREPWWEVDDPSGHLSQ
jgi:ribonuclease HI